MHFEFAYSKIPKISPGAYIFQRQGLIFGGAYIWRDICLSKSARLILGGKSIGLAYSWKEVLLKLALRT